MAKMKGAIVGKALVKGWYRGVAFVSVFDVVKNWQPVTNKSGTYKSHRKASGFVTVVNPLFNGSGDSANEFTSLQKEVLKIGGPVIRITCGKDKVTFVNDTAVAEQVAEPVAEPVAEQVAEAVAEQVAEPVAEPVAEQVAETAPSEEVVDTQTESVAETVTEETPADNSSDNDNWSGITIIRLLDKTDDDDADSDESLVETM